MAFPVGSSAQKLTIDNSKVSGSANLTNFPVLVKDGNILDATYASMEGDGDDIRFTTDEAGTSEIPFEIVALDSEAKTCEIWVKLTVDHDDDTDFYIWYGDSSLSAYAANATYGSENVWSDYRATYRLQDEIDATSNGFDLTNNDGVTFSTAKIGDGAVVSDTPSYLTGQASETVAMATTAFTISFWVKNDSEITSSPAFSSYMFISDNNKVYCFLRYEYNGGTKRLMFERTKYGVEQIKVFGNVTMSNTWHHVALRWDGTNLKGYYDGSEIATGASASGSGSTAVSPSLDLQVTLGGMIDEARLRQSALTPDWITTEYNNQNAPSTFITGSSIGGGRRIFLIS